VWKFRHRNRGRPAGIEGPERRHRAGRETLITGEVIRCPLHSVQWPNAVLLVDARELLVDLDFFELR
jgi:hypothetical protein